ncbi:PTS system cellobiose-specific transporter subunit IIC [Enterococcus faecium]|nr:PTS system cellobiose-specific transporter subunit IIC [Enterococcus faecium]
MFDFLQKYLMGPMGKIAQLKIVRAVMAAGMASIPFTIVGSMFLVLNILPLPFPFLEGFFNATFFKVSDLYMIVNTMTMGILSIYFAIVFAYELTSIERDEQKLNVNPLTGALLSVFAFFMCIPELIMTDGKISLIASINETETVVNGIRMGSFVERLGTSGIFTAIIMSIIAVELYCMCVKRNWVIKMPDVVPPGVSRSFTALIPTFVIAFVVMIINGLLVALGTDIFINCQIKLDNSSLHMCCLLYTSLSSLILQSALQNDCYPIWVCYAVDEYMAWCHGDLFLDPCIVDRRDPWSEYHHFFLDPDRIS